MTKLNVEQHDYLIIGGTTKAATTSLYSYLADHPEVSATTLKETRFFLDGTYPVQPQAATWQDGIEEFESFFKSNSSKLRVEATPDYLYSTGTPKRIKSLLPNAKVVFILRDPINRLVSWYNYSKQRNNIPKSMNFDEYIEKQIGDRHDLKTDDYFLSTLEHGRYSKFIQNYIDELGQEKIKIYFYEELCADPSKVLQDLCTFSSLDPDFYRSYDFKVFNKSVKIANAKLNALYAQFRRLIRRRTHNLPIHDVLRQLRLWFDPIYYRLNSQATEKVEISPQMRARLEDYYKDDVQVLERILNRPAPWQIKHAVEIMTN